MKRFLPLLLLLLTPSVFAATSGVAFSASGDPLGGVRVTAHRPAWPSLADIERPALATTTTADDGTFTLDTKVAGVLEVRAERDGYAPMVMHVLSGATDLAIDLPIAKAINGRVNAGGALIIASNGEGVVWTTHADEKGAFTIADPRGWCSYLTIVHPDFAPLNIPITNAQPALNVTLTAGTNVSGRVVDANGRAVKSARVQAGLWRETKSTEDGSFTLHHVGIDEKRITAIDGATAGSAARSDKDLTIRLEPKRAISGVVRDAENRPLAGARIAAWTSKPPSEVQRAVSDDKGNYRIEHCAAEEYQVSLMGVTDLEFGIQGAKLQKQKLAQVDFTASAMKYLRGTVVDERKRPVGGAVVTYASPPIPMIYGVIAQEVMTTRTSADGKFRLAVMEIFQDKERIRLQALHRRFAIGLSEPFELEKRTSPITITLPDGIETRGIVVDTEGKPVGGAAIIAMQDPYGAVALPIDTLLSMRGVRPLVSSDAEGKFALHLNAAPHDIGVWKEGYAGFRQGGITPKEGSEPLTIVLEAGAQIRGRVTRKSSTQPVSGMIYAEGDDGSSAMAALENDGSFSLDSLRPGEYTLRVGGVGASSAQKHVKAPARDVLIELPAVGEIRGRVADKATGRALSSFEIEVGPDTRNFEEESFTLQLEQGETQVVAHAAGYIPEAKQVSIQAGKVVDLSFELTRGRTAYGRITGENGTPVEEAMISVDTGRSMSSSDEDGEFRFEGLTRDRVTIEVSANGFVSRNVDVEAGELDTRVDVVLSRGKKATGRVITSSGAPVADAEVYAFASSSGHAKTKVDGTFVIEGLTDERYSFQASREGVGSAEVNDADISREVVITIEPVTAWGSIHGKVKGFVEGGWMFGAVIADEAHDDRGQIGRDGTYRLEKVPAGETELRAMAMSMRGNATTSPLTVTVVANQDIEVDLAFRTDITIRGTVFDGGEPAVGRRVNFSNEATDVSATTGEGGAYTIPAIEPGSYEVSVGSDENPSGAFNTRYQVTGSATFDIRIERAEIEGRVVDDQGAPIQGVKIEVTSATTNDSVAQTLTAANGAFRVPVFRGTHVVTAKKKGFATAVQKIDGDPMPVVLKMTRSDGLRVRLSDARSGATLHGYVVATDAAGLNVARLDEAQSDGTMLVALAAGSYRISASAGGFATQSVRVTVPRPEELRIALTPGGTLIINANDGASDLVKLVMPNGDEYVRCECNGIAEIRLTGAVTEIEHVAPGNYTLQVLDARGLVKAGYPVTISEAATTTARIHVPD